MGSKVKLPHPSPRIQSRKLLQNEVQQPTKRAATLNSKTISSRSQMTRVLVTKMMRPTTTFGVDKDKRRTGESQPVKQKTLRKMKMTKKMKVSKTVKRTAMAKKRVKRTRKKEAENNQCQAIRFLLVGKVVVTLEIKLGRSNP